MGMFINLWKSFSIGFFNDIVKVVTREELVNNCGSGKVSGKKVVNKGEQGYMIQLDPAFHEFLASRPQPDVKYHRKRSPNYRYLK